LHRIRCRYPPFCDIAASGGDGGFASLDGVAFTYFYDQAARYIIATIAEFQRRFYVSTTMKITT